MSAPLSPFQGLTIDRVSFLGKGDRKIYIHFLTRLTSSHPYNSHPHRTIRVKSGGSIQSAISIANPGTTISVPPGTYREQLLITTPSITLIGHNAILTPPPSFINNTCTNLAGAGTQAGIWISGDGVVLQDLKDFNGEHLKVFSVGSYIKDIIITGFTIKNFGGLNIAIVGCENTIIENNAVSSASQYDILTVGSKNSKIQQNTVLSTPGIFPSYFIGICMDDTITVTISHNKISNYFIGLCVQTPHAHIYENYVHDVCAGAFVDPDIKNARIERNAFKNKPLDVLTPWGLRAELQFRAGLGRW